MKVAHMMQALLAIVLVTGASCSTHSKTTKDRVALIRTQNVELLSINGSRVDVSQAVVIIAGRNDIEFRWPRYQEDFRLPTVYRLVMNAESGVEYVITPHPKSGFLCAWRSDPESGIDFEANAGCVSRQPV